jgi:leucyl-tRNA synthetase
VHQTIQKVTDDIEERFHFNTAIAAVMELVNAFYQTLETLPREDLTFWVWREALEALVKLLNPMVPHIAEEVWQTLGYETSLQLQPWPAANPEALVETSFTLVVQVNGKVRGKIEAPASATEAQLKELALQSPAVQKWLKGEPKRVVLARGKLVNIVT